MMKLCFLAKIAVTICLLVFVNLVTAQDIANNNLLTVEELRIEKAQQYMPTIFKPLKDRVNQYTSQINQARNLTALTQLTLRNSSELWKEGVKSFDEVGQYDDRSLYWARLQMSKALRLSPAFKSLLPVQQQNLLWQLELLSRGKNDVKFDKGTDKKILITGFDPFFLDRNIDQSNPSGVAALALDDLVISRDGKSAEIETLIVPVRFADFDKGMIETLLAPYYNKVDMIITISMGRENFDLERFPGLRRSAKAPDNLNVYTGANSEVPLLPILLGKNLPNDEFVEFSLPVSAMEKATGNYKVIDNRVVSTLTKQFTPQSLNELKGHVSVQGSGGGYLSNEISYRSIVLRNEKNPVLPVGHIHTPRIKAFQPQTSESIVKQIKQMLTHAINAI
jgi:pyrrolidone-carboxylate peptidase